MTTEYRDDEQRFALDIVGIIVGFIISTIVGYHDSNDDLKMNGALSKQRAESV